MKIAIAADSHGRIESLKKQLIKAQPQQLIFAGDLLGDARRLAFHLNLPFSAVLGNCDGKSSGEREITFELGGKRFYLTHGHQYRVKSSLQALFYRGQEIGADVVIFGHTHIPCCEEINGLWMLNPGSAARPRQGKLASYILLELSESSFCPQIIYFEA